MLGKELAEIFLAPFSDLLGSCSELIVVPHGSAHAMPFQALWWRDKPLAETMRISYLPSAGTLQYIQRRSELPKTILTVGNPGRMSHRPPLSGKSVAANSLPAAELEAIYVASLFPRGKSLVGDEATESTVRQLLPDYPLLHFATHAVLLENAPMLSEILLADGEAMSVYELMGMNLNAELVVLSACETALGDVTGGDDLIGFTRGLLGAGARSAVVSLWPVDDVSTSLLMGEFYRCQSQGESVAKALQTAQLFLRNLKPEAMMSKMLAIKKISKTRHIGVDINVEFEIYHHPYYWAPFILVG
ncbi:CHAT domain-containing protein [candidate division KSB1 bacterium]|nr:CHAT domain-containing protein [candidate division KSB1 bacterium]